MPVNLAQLEKDLEAYPQKLKAALKKEADCEELVEDLESQLETFDEEHGFSIPPRKALPDRPTTLLGMRLNDQRLRELNDQLRVTLDDIKLEVQQNPTEYNLPGRPALWMIEAQARKDSRVQNAQKALDVRKREIEREYQELGQLNVPNNDGEQDTEEDPSEAQKERQRLFEQLSKAKLKLREARADRAVVEALPGHYDLLIKLAHVQILTKQGDASQG